MKIIKRSGMEVEFDRSKIIAAVKRANNSVVEGEKVSDEQVEKIAENVETICGNESCAQCRGDSGFSRESDHEPEGIPSGK